MGIRFTVDPVATHTGTALQQWMTELDAAGGRSMSPRQLRAFLQTKHGLKNPWHNEVAGRYEAYLGRDLENQQRNGLFRVAVAVRIAADPITVFRTFVSSEGFASWLGSPSGAPTGPGSEFPLGQDTLRVTDVFEFADASYVRMERHRDENFAILHASFRPSPLTTKVEFAESNLPDAEARDASKVFWRSVLDRLTVAAAANATGSILTS